MRDKRTIYVLVATWLFPYAALSTTPTIASAFLQISHPSRHASSAMMSPASSWSSNKNCRRSDLLELNMASNENKDSSSASPPPPKPALLAEFEYQELKIQLNALQEQGVLFSQLRSDKKNELEGFVRRIVNRRPSPIPLYELGQALTQQQTTKTKTKNNNNNNRQWKLVFSTQLLTTESLPKDATVLIKFLNDKELEYSLKFGKRTMGLNRLTAKSTYTVDPGPVNPGLVTFVYKDITTDAFGLKNIGVGFFGLLQGRSNYIPTAYFDEQLWIERGTDVNGAEYFNVYAPPIKAKDDEDDDDDDDADTIGGAKGMWED